MKKKLHKSRNQKKLCGVCGGLAEFLDIDVSLIRIIWFAFSFFYGTGILLYLIAALILPYEGE